MRAFKFFDKVGDYEDFVFGEVFQTDLIRKNPFYSKVILWVLQNRTPMFFEASDDAEFAHFSQYFGLMLMRRYDNPYLSDMYYLHDFVHLLFRNPQHPKSMPFAQFADTAITNEFVASNETEMLAHVRIPELNEYLGLSNMLYPILVNRGYREWNPHDLLTLRRALMTGDLFWDLLGNNADGQITRVKKYMNHASNNAMWTSMWYENVPDGLRNWQYDHVYLSHENYHNEVMKFEYGVAGKSWYSNNMAANISAWMSLIYEGQKAHYEFTEIPRILSLMEHRIIMPEVARTFNQLYQAKKKRE